MYYCCKEHVELALDTVVDEKEMAPIMETVSKENELSTLCSFCEKLAVFKVTS